MDEDPTEQVHEDIHEHAHGAKEKWIAWAALTAAFLAALAAITGSMAATHLTESSRAQIKSNDDWGYYQANSIKESIVASRDSILAALGRPAPPEDAKQLEKYETEKAHLLASAKDETAQSDAELKIHETLDTAETFSHIAIAAVAIAVLTKRRSFWALSLGLGALGLVFLALGILHRI